MACEDSTAASAALAAAAAGPARVKGDAGEVESHKLSDLIAYEKHQKSKCAARSTRLGIRFIQLTPPGSV